MDSVFIQKPSLLIFVAVIVVLHLIAKKHPSTLITAINIAVHSFAVYKIAMAGGKNTDILLLMLVSVLIAMTGTSSDPSDDAEIAAPAEKAEKAEKEVGEK